MTKTLLLASTALLIVLTGCSVRPDPITLDQQIAQAELDRAQQLVDRGFISKADLQRRTATRDAAAARVRAAQATYREAQARNGRLDIRAPAADPSTLTTEASRSCLSIGRRSGYSREMSWSKATINRSSSNSAGRSSSRLLSYMMTRLSGGYRT